jgi:hypothetical protein
MWVGLQGRREGSTSANDYKIETLHLNLVSHDEYACM